MMFNKKGQDTSPTMLLLVSLLCVSIVYVSAIAFLNGIKTNYDVTYNATELSAFDNFNNVNNNISRLSETINPSTGQQTSDTDPITTMIFSGWSFIKLLWNIPQMFYSMVAKVVSILGLPSAITGIIALLILIVILYAAWLAIMKVRA
jgi:membrane protein insertase Oxa1/YidC/SpoIIIJ